MESNSQSLVSIVTPSYQQGIFIGDAIASVVNQDYPYIEHIIVDGGSSDCTLDVVEQNSRYISYFVSEKDSGTSEAINKGFSKAGGDYVWILNADDLLAGNKAIGMLVEYMQRNDDVDFVYGDMLLINARGGYIGRRRFPQYDTARLIMDRRYLPFPGCLVRRAALDAVGGFDETIKYANDLDFLLRLARRRRLGRLGAITGVLRIHKEASTQRHIVELGNEVTAVCARYMEDNLAGAETAIPVRKLKAAVCTFTASYSFHGGLRKNTVNAVLSAFATWPASILNPKLWIYLACACFGDRTMHRLSKISRLLIQRRLFFSLNNLW